MKISGGRTVASRSGAAWGAALLGAALVLGAGGASAATLGGHVARWVQDARRVGPADESQTVRLKAFLGFRDPAGLSKLLAAQQTPGSPEYRRFLSAAEFHARFSPSAADAAAVEAGLRAAGFTVTGRPPSNLFVDFSGTVGQIKAAFAVSQDLYAYRGKVIRANVEAPRLPAALAGRVTAIVGLADTGPLIHPLHVSINDEASRAAKSAAPTAAGGVSPSVGLPVAANLPSPYCSTYYGDTVATLSTAPNPYAAQLPWLVCGYTPQQLRVAYGANKVSLDGTGVRVGIVDAYTSPTLIPDLNRYSARHRLPRVSEGANFRTIYNGNLAKVSANDVCDPQGWFGEISLDVDAVHGMAPGANIVFSGALSCSNVDLEGALYTLVDGTASEFGPFADIVSNSYGMTGEAVSDAEANVQEAIFQQASAEGVTVLFSSGDKGDVAVQTGDAQASYPASSPQVTAVGGTSLALEGAGGRKLEWGWGTFRDYLGGATVNSASSVTDSGLDGAGFAAYLGAGGGPSSLFPSPSYQSAVPLRLRTTSYAYPSGTTESLGGRFRVTPDVSMVADPYTGFLYGESELIAGDPVKDAGCTALNATIEYCEGSIGGTSLSSPLFAGVLALAEQQRATNGLPRALGAINGALYALSVGQRGSTSDPLIDVRPPATPTAVLRGYAGDPSRVRVVTMNSTPGPYGPLCAGAFCNGADTWSLQTRANYDNVTGQGAPYIPALVAALASPS